VLSNPVFGVEKIGISEAHDQFASRNFPEIDFSFLEQSGLKLHTNLYTNITLLGPKFAVYNIHNPFFTVGVETPVYFHVSKTEPTLVDPINGHISLVVIFPKILKSILSVI
jgi:hypothetical protein